MGGVISSVAKPIRKVIKEVVPKPVKEAAEAVASPIIKELAPDTSRGMGGTQLAAAQDAAKKTAGGEAATAMTATPTAPTRQVAQTGAGAYDKRRRRGMATRTRATGSRGVLGAAPVERKTILGG